MDTHLSTLQLFVYLAGCTLCFRNVHLVVALVNTDSGHQVHIACTWTFGSLVCIPDTTARTCCSQSARRAMAAPAL